MNKRIAVFAGSFDPITAGHESIVRRAIPLFDEIIVAVGKNSAKNYMFNLEQRVDWIKKTFADSPTVKVDLFEGLTVNYCKEKGASFLLRGLRTAADFEFEKAIAHMNQAMNPALETVFILTAPEHSALSSTIVREILRYKGDVSRFVPKAVKFNP